ncbi:MAG: hypothetical protein LBD79_00985 [Treponema sp.]|jgi:DNA-binding GntR family transcriptional regulator|nr:hypothetical protein [Treponema sp.]
MWNSILPVIDALDALNRLEREGLVESILYTGSRVVDIDKGKQAVISILWEAIAWIVRILYFTSYDERHYQFHLNLVQLTSGKTLKASSPR